MNDYVTVKTRLINILDKELFSLLFFSLKTLFWPKKRVSCKSCLVTPQVICEDKDSDIYNERKVSSHFLKFFYIKYEINRRK